MREILPRSECPKITTIIYDHLPHKGLNSVIRVNLWRHQKVGETSLVPI